MHNRHWSRVIQAVTANFEGQQIEGQTLKERLCSLGPITDRHAKLIARDQTSKLNSSLTKIRHQEVGIESYIWRTAEDERVVGTPGGLYPKPSNRAMHGDHYARNGRTFYYDRPPADGSPGQAIQCRCVGLPVVYVDKLNLG